MNVTRLWLCLVVLLISAHRLPAPISELPTPTSAPRPKHARQATTARESNVELTDLSRKARESKNSGGRATVFVYRPAGFGWGIYNHTVITIDGAEACTMADPRYTVRKLRPGKHVFEATGGVVTHQHTPIAIDLQGDQKYYFRITIDAWGFPEGKIIFTRAPSAQAVEELAKLTQAP
jgi:hypothetical protein